MVEGSDQNVVVSYKLHNSSGLTSQKRVKSASVVKANYTKHTARAALAPQPAGDNFPIFL